MPFNRTLGHSLLGRRAMLRSLGLAGAGVASASMFDRAQAATRPTRIIFLYSENGTLPTLARPVGVGGQGTPTETSWDLGELHAPYLQPYKKDLLFLENVDMLSADLDVTPFSGSHERLQVHMLTGAPRKGPTTAGGASVDQFIAKQINSPGAVTAFPSLQYESGQSYGGQNAYWSGPGLYVDTERDAVKAYDRIFKTIDTSARDRDARKNKLMFDVLKKDFDNLSGKLSANSKTKIDAHGSAIRDLESRLGLVASNTVCSPPLRTTAAALTGQNKATKKYWDDSTDVFMRMATVALSCDLARVVSINLGGLMPAEITGYDNDIHVGLLHGFSGEQPIATLKNRGGYISAFKYYDWYAQQFGKLLGLLKAMPEGDPGQTMLDHTVVCWYSEFGNPGHDAHNMPYILAGGANGYLRTGRFISYPRRAATAEEKAIDAMAGDKAQTPATRGVPHNNLLVSLANAMGVNINTYGNPACCTGPLAGLH